MPAILTTHQTVPGQVRFATMLGGERGGKTCKLPSRHRVDGFFCLSFDSLLLLVNRTLVICSPLSLLPSRPSLFLWCSAPLQIRLPWVSPSVHK